ncbi:hypothetical protein OWV82_006385 [Melia azedarach]|uniref:Uncharacterized protein n=1 Tax=Melia azedarach TaxID=155640 RepID=A0ACC1YGL4_MELAZ|nr:hypothetical protein OWV82_006385 [Melia azedarach]
MVLDSGFGPLGTSWKAALNCRSVVALAAVATVLVVFVVVGGDFCVAGGEYERRYLLADREEEEEEDNWDSFGRAKRGEIKGIISRSSSRKAEDDFVAEAMK